MKNLFRRSKMLVKKKLIRPILRSVYSPEEVALGVSVGVFWGFMPLVGIQMYMVFFTWLLFKAIFKRDFDLVVGMSMVWISNPLTMFFMYYAFYFCGVYLFNFLGAETQLISYSAFEYKFLSILGNLNFNYIEKIWEGMKLLLFEFGATLMLGALVIAIPLTLISYRQTKPFIEKRHRLRAVKKGMVYEDWVEKYTRTPKKITRKFP